MAVTNPKPADANADGKVTKKEQAAYNKAQAAKKGAKTGLTGDTLSQAELAKKYGYALRVLKSDPELWDLFQRASNFKKGAWTEDEFTAQLMDTKWWQNNSESARRGLTAKALGGADWDVMLQEGRNAVQQEATAQGYDLDQATLDDLAEDYIMGGWSQADRRQQLTDAIVKRGTAGGGGGYLQGNAGDLQEQILAIGEANGLSLSREYAAQAARSVAMGLTTEEDWLRTTREQAASMWGPAWQDKIMAGVDAKELASGYINIMAQTFEIDPEMISLNDPDLRAAMTGIDEKGNPKPVSLYDFQTKLRKDPRWMGTKQAQDTFSNIGMDILKTFGFVG